MSLWPTLRKAWLAREYILGSVRRELAARYLGTQLGGVWAVIQPVALIAIYTLVFSDIMRPALPGHVGRFAYSINLCAGLVLWQLFSELTSRSVAMFVQNASLLKKSTVPKFSLALVVALVSLCDFGIMLAAFLMFLLVTGSFPGLVALGILPLSVIVLALGMGLGVFLGVVNVFYRDVGHVLALVLNFWFWLTPIVYPARLLPAWLETALAWNPLTPIVRFSQTLFLDGTMLSLSTLAYPAAMALLLLGMAIQVYRKLGDEIVDEL